MLPLANINGVLMPLAEAKVSALDRGFLFGDAVYEVLRIYSGRPWLLQEHFQRLALSLEAIRLKGVDLGRLEQRLRSTIVAGPFTEAITYIQITRGTAPRKHAFPVSSTPLEFLYVDDFSDPYLEGRERGVAVISQPDLRWDRCDIKSTNLLGNVLAMQAAVEAGAVEALLYLPDGTLTEGTHTSFFAVMEKGILTAPNSPAILPGITRGLILSMAAGAGFGVRERPLNRNEFGKVSELFLTGTTSEVLPVTRVDGQTIGDGKPGPVTRKIQELYAAAVGAFRRGTA